MIDSEENLAYSVSELIEYGVQKEYFRSAFYHVLGKRLLDQGYVDATYILKGGSRSSFRSSLKNTPIQSLYEKSCIPSENIDVMISYLENIVENLQTLSELEEEALVYWLFIPYHTVSKRELCTTYLLQILQEGYSRWSWGENYNLCDFAVSYGIIFDKNKCDLQVITSVENYAREIFALKKEHINEILFYRGHSRLSYFLRPGIKRENSWLENENVMYQELLVRCAQEFIHCQAHLDYLVEMQHYGLPTRLLDVTENPLVALYFACCSNTDKLGEVIVLREEMRRVKYAKSDTAAVLSALPTLNYTEQKKLYDLCTNGKAEDKDTEYRELAGKLAAEIKSRNPAFEPKIKKRDLLGYVFVTPIRSNQRIMKQDGSFILCGLGESNDLERLRCRDSMGKTIVFVIKSKEKILKDLDILSINRACLFPEIDDVAEYIKGKYRQD